MKAAFVLASVMGQSMILNRYDYDPQSGVGVGAGLLSGGIPNLLPLLFRLAAERRQSHGDGVVVVDGGANIGSLCVPLAKYMEGWGDVIAFEPQRWPYYALCGNLCLNNCFNVTAVQWALVDVARNLSVPVHDPQKPCNAGGMSLLSDDVAADTDNVHGLAIDDVPLPRLDILKLDIEGMEPQALRGAKATIARHKPIIIAEGFICGPENIVAELADYECLGIGPDVLCIHRDERNAGLRQAMRDLAKQMKSPLAR